MADILRDLTFAGLVGEHARGFPTKAATVFEEASHTWPEFEQRAHRLANALERQGVGEGDRILWAGQNAPAILELLVACSIIGAMICPLNWRQTASEIAFVVDDLEPKIVFRQDDELRDVLDEAFAKAQFAPEHDIAVGEPYERFLAQGDEFIRDTVADPDLPVLILYTAAFEGRPNGAMLSQTAMLWQDVSIFAVQRLSHKSVFLNSGPLFHIGTFMVTLATMHLGGTNVFIKRPRAEEICQAIVDNRCTVAFLMGKTQQEIVELNRDGKYDLTCLTSATQFDDWDAMVTILPEVSLFGFGQTEVSGPVIWRTYGNFDESIGTNGRVGPSAFVRIFDEQGNEVPVGEVGELAVRGPTVMNGYWRRPELTAYRQRNGWHHSNDLGRREVDGSFSFVGPKTQMIKSGAENIYPSEVEGCLRRHPDVEECAIIGIPDAQFIQSVRAIIRLKDGAAPAAEGLIDFCRQNIASYKKPKSVVFVDTLPRTPTGGIDYAALDLAHGGGNYPGSYVVNN